jgi:hypothetical protein
MIISLDILMTALLFGGMALYSFGFAAFLFTALPAAKANTTLQRAFPVSYMYMLSRTNSSKRCL